jgi:hypothetical protein
MAYREEKKRYLHWYILFNASPMSRGQFKMNCPLMR